MKILKELNSMGIMGEMMHNSPLRNEAIEMLSKNGSDKATKNAATRLKNKWSKIDADYTFKKRVELMRAKNV
ncbi:hypothetical protein ACDT12_13185, partial [Staphylococcus aureus]